MHMLDRRYRLAARLLAISLLAATLYAVDSLASPSPAEARCVGPNTPVRSTFSYDGYLRVSETPGTGTCNENGTYSGTLKDERADGNCVSVQFKETGFDWAFPNGGTTCGGTSTFQWSDHSGNNNQAWQRFCISNPNIGFYRCGWGTAWGYPENSPYGLNSGY
jgi:hypothetical protein